MSANKKVITLYGLNYIESGISIDENRERTIYYSSENGEFGLTVKGDIIDTSKCWKPSF